ncbi:MAG: ABC transporter permease [Christensenellales bacterium]|jgi:ABC-2 type transport system permease protein
MNKSLIFAKRNFKELARDVLTLVFTILLPVAVFLIILFLTKKISIPNTAFEIQSFTPATIIFAFSFLTLFSSMLLAKDRSSAFLTRLLVSPLKPVHYILGYTLPIIAISLIQNIIVFGVALLFGLGFSFNILLVILATIPISILFSSLGLILGSVLSDKQASGVTSVLIQIVSFTNGMWFDLEMIGGGYKIFSYILPFAHSVDLLKHLLAGNFSAIWLPLIVVVAYAIIFTLLAIFLFKKVGTKK